MLQDPNMTRRNLVFTVPQALISWICSLIGILLFWAWFGARVYLEDVMRLPTTILDSGLLPPSWAERFRALSYSASNSLLQLLYRLLGLAHQENIALAPAGGNNEAYPAPMQAVVDASTGQASTTPRRAEEERRGLGDLTAFLAATSSERRDLNLVEVWRSHFPPSLGEATDRNILIYLAASYLMVRSGATPADGDGEVSARSLLTIVQRDAPRLFKALVL